MLSLKLLMTAKQRRDRLFSDVRGRLDIFAFLDLNFQDFVTFIAFGLVLSCFPNFRGLSLQSIESGVEFVLHCLRM